MTVRDDLAAAAETCMDRLRVVLADGTEPPGQPPVHRAHFDEAAAGPDKAPDREEQT